MNDVVSRSTADAKPFQNKVRENWHSLFLDDQYRQTITEEVHDWELNDPV